MIECGATLHNENSREAIMPENAFKIKIKFEKTSNHLNKCEYLRSHYY